MSNMALRLLMRKGGPTVSPLVGGYLDAFANEANQNSYTFTPVPFGTAAADRNIIVTMVAREWTGSIPAPTVTVGGVTATLVVNTTPSPDFEMAAVYRAVVPTGTTGTIVVNFGASQATRIGLGVWGIYGTIGSTSTASARSVTNPGLSVTSAVGGFIVAMAMNATAGAPFTWTNATERYDGSPANFTMSNADSSATGATTITPSGTTIYAVAAAFRP